MWEYRSLGLPQIIDCIPFYSNRNGYHYWCTTPPILYKETNVTGAFDRRSAKVYRHTFSRNPTITPINGEYIPEFFQDPFLQDVTDTYYYTTNIEIEGNIPDSLSHVFLCVFNNLPYPQTNTRHRNGYQKGGNHTPIPFSPPSHDPANPGVIFTPFSEYSFLILAARHPDTFCNSGKTETVMRNSTDRQCRSMSNRCP